MREVGAAAMPIIPTFDGIKADLERGLNDPMRAAGKKGGKDFGDNAGDSMRTSLSGHAKKAALLAAGAVAATGAVAGAGFVKYLGEALDRDVVEDRLAAALGASPKIAERYGQVASNLYAGAWGESFDEVARGVEAVGSSFKRLRTAEDLERVSAQALDFATIFETDVTDAVAKAATVMKSGLASDATEAFDLITAASQRVPSALRGDLLDAADEYGQFFDALGLSGEQAFGILVKGSRKGVYGLDKAGDAIKEFTILSTDGSKSTSLAFESIGLDAEKMANDLLAGGDRANKAFGQVLEGLLAIEDPATRAQTSLALFGTPLEDLGVNGIPQFLRSLRDGTRGLKDWKGSIDDAGKTLNDNASTRFTSFKRSLEQNVVDFLGNKAVPVIERDVLPALERFGKWFGDKGAPAIETFIDDARPVAEEVLPAIGNAVDAIGGFLKTAAPYAKDLVGAFNDMPDWITDTAVLGALGLAVGAKVKGGKGGGVAGGLLGGGKGSSLNNPMYVFVVNGAGGAGGAGRGPKGGPGLPGLIATAAVVGTATPTQANSTQSLFNSIDADGSLKKLRDALETDLGKYADDLKIDLDRLATELHEVGAGSEYVQTSLEKLDKAAKPGFWQDLTDGINPFSNKVGDIATALDHINAELSTLDRRARDRKNLADLDALAANDRPGNGLANLFGKDAATGKAFDKIPEGKLKVLQDPATIKTQEDARKLLGNVDSLTKRDFKLIFSALGLKRAKDDAKELEDTLRRLAGLGVTGTSYGPGFIGPVPPGTPRRTASNPSGGGLNVGRIDVYTNDSQKFVQDLTDRKRRASIGGYS